MARMKHQRDVRIGRRLRYHRQLAGLSIEQLAAKVGRSDRSISNIEVGWRSFPIMHTAQFAAALSMTTEQLADELGLHPDRDDAIEPERVPA